MVAKITLSQFWSSISTARASLLVMTLKCSFFHSWLTIMPFFTRMATPPCKGTNFSQTSHVCYFCIRLNMKNSNDRFSDNLFHMLFQMIGWEKHAFGWCLGVTIGVAKNVIFLTALHWSKLMWHPHFASNVQWRSTNQKIFRLCCLASNVCQFCKGFNIQKIPIQATNISIEIGNMLK